jgi:hypothetical protein
VAIDDNHVPIIGGAASGLTTQVLRESAVHGAPVTDVSVMESKVVSSLEQANEGITNEVFMTESAWSPHVWFW